MSKCKICGCTDNHACPGGCFWVTRDEDICSNCAINQIFESRDRKIRYKLYAFFFDKDDRGLFKARYANVTDHIRAVTMNLAAVFRVKMRWVPNPTMEELHGKVVGTRFEPYNDVTIYEDGHEEWFKIGD